MASIAIERLDGGVARATIDRPEKRNAVDPATREALADALAGLSADASVRALVLTGAGGNFSAGGDLGTMDGMDGPAARRRMKGGHRLVRALAEFERPVVAAVEGFAFGAGASLMLLADFAVAGRGATIGFPFLKIGLVPDWGMLHALPRRVGLARARRLICLAESVPAPDALAIGLLDEVVEDAEVQGRALDLARRLAALPPHAFAATKRQLALQPAPLDATLEAEALAQSLLFTGAEFAEGLAAFRERRPARFPDA
jgi:2-(1,2-epoxy-1,2-dihydrophenyl)acetyl-CoA isomerase